MEWELGNISPGDYGTFELIVLVSTQAAPGNEITNQVEVSVVQEEENDKNNFSSWSTQISNPIPTLTSLNPSVKTAGDPSFTLTIEGSNFVDGFSTVRWNGVDRTTTFVSSTQLQAAITAADIASAGTASVTVFNSAPGGGESNALTFTIDPAPNPVATLNSLNPASTTAGGPAFTLTVNGTNFVNGVSTVRWNGVDRTTTFVSSTQLQAAITAADIATPGSASFTVFNTAPGGGISNELEFVINDELPIPVTGGDMIFLPMVGR